MKECEADESRCLPLIEQRQCLYLLGDSLDRSLSDKEVAALNLAKAEVNSAPSMLSRR